MVEPRRRKPSFCVAATPSEMARVQAEGCKNVRHAGGGIPMTYEAQGLIGLRRYADNWILIHKRKRLVGTGFFSRKLFLAWYDKNPRPGNCCLVRIDTSKLCTPDNVKYVHPVFRDSAVTSRRNGGYIGVSWDKGFEGIKGRWRGTVKLVEINRRIVVYREFESEKQAARWVDWVLEKKYGVYAVFNRDLNKELGMECFDDIPLELYGGYNNHGR